MRRALPLALVLASVMIPRLASADEPSGRNACGRAYERAQRLRQAHQLKAARSELLVCSRAECPAWVRNDCVTWLGALEVAMPSIIVAARNADGTPRTDARVIIDGKTVMERLTPDAIPIDPGKHVLIVEAVGVARVSQQLTVREGERDRRITVTFESTDVAPPAPVEPVAPARPTPAPERAEPGPRQDRPVPALVYVLGSTGIVASAFGAYFQVSGMSQRSDLHRCAPDCAESDIDEARRSLWIGNIALGAGVLSLGAALWLYLARPTLDVPKNAVQLDARGVRGGFIGGITAHF